VSCSIPTSLKGSEMSLPMLGIVPGTLIAVGFVVLAVVLLAYAVYFLFFKMK